MLEQNGLDIDEAFGLVLREIREFRGMRQDSFGSAASRNYIGRLEKGEHSPTLERVEKIAGALGVDPVLLLLWSYDRAGAKELGTSGVKGNDALKKLMAAMLDLEEKK